jgi:hypothetical protein
LKNIALRCNITALLHVGRDEKLKI